MDTVSVSTTEFCSSYAEVQRFQKNVADMVTSDELGGPLPDMVVFAADNVDHNILTIDGKGTFHGMGMISETTAGIQRSHMVTRKNVSLLNVKEMAQVSIIYYRFSNYARRHILLETLPKLYCTASTVDILWAPSLRFHQQVPNWKEMIHTIYR